MMNYKDFEEARAKRSAKEITKANKVKGKRGHKRKSSTLEAEVEVGPSIPEVTVVRMGKVRPVEAKEVRWRAPVAKMY